MRIKNTFTCVFQAYLPPSCSQMRKKTISKNSSRARNKVVREKCVPPRPRLSHTVVCNENSTLHKTTRHSMTPDEKLCSPSLLSKLQLLSLPTIQASHHKLLNSDYPRQL
jgi:hypothetical protein